MNRLAPLFWGSLAIKLALLSVVPLTNDEAYYWVWSQHPQLSYFDHPPFVAWLFGLGQYLRFVPGGVRWPGALLAHLGLWIWLKVLEPWLDEDGRWWWLALAMTSPLLGGSALVITPDTPLIFFYGVAALGYQRWRAAPTPGAAGALGLAVGLGLTSKYMMVLFPLSVLVPTLRDPALRRAFVRGLPAATLGVVIGTFPVWLWNLTNDFASFRFQAHHGLGRTFYKSSWTTEYLGVQIALVTPWLAVLAWRGRAHAPRFFPWLAITPLAFFAVTTARGYAEANWPIAAYPAVLALAVAARPRRSAWLSDTLWLWTAALAGLAFVIVTDPPFARASKLREFHQFDAVIAATRDVRPLYARSYQMASRLSFELGRPVYKIRGMLRHDFFDELPESVPAPGAYSVVVERGDRLPDQFAARGDRVIETTRVDETFDLLKVDTR